MPVYLLEDKNHHFRVASIQNLSPLKISKQSIRSTSSKLAVFERAEKILSTL